MSAAESPARPAPEPVLTLSHPALSRLAETIERSANLCFASLAADKVSAADRVTLVVNILARSAACAALCAGASEATRQSLLDVTGAHFDACAAAMQARAKARAAS